MKTFPDLNLPIMAIKLKKNTHYNIFKVTYIGKTYSYLFASKTTFIRDVFKNENINVTFVLILKLQQRCFTERIEKTLWLPISRNDLDIRSSPVFHHLEYTQPSN